MPARVYLAEGLLLGPASFFLFRALASRVNPWVSGPLVFTLTLLAGELILAMLWRDLAAPYLEDALVDTFIFAWYGLLAAVTYKATEMYIAVRPNLGLAAVLVFLLFLSLSENGRRRFRV